MGAKHAIANAIHDARAPFGVRISEGLASAARIVAFLALARRRP